MLRLLALVCGLAAMGYSFLAAFRSGLQMADGIDAYVIAAAFVGLVLGSLVFGPATSQALQSRAWFRGTWFCALWVLTTLVVLANSTGYIATHRRDTVGDKQVRIDRYEQAKAELTSLNSERQAADAAGRVKRSDKLQQRIQEANSIVSAGRPGASDAQAEVLSWITMGWLSAGTAAQAQPVWLAISLDLVANGCFLLAFTRSRRPAEQPQRKSKRRSKVPRLRKPAAPTVEPVTRAKVIDIDAKRAQRTGVSQALR